MIGPFKFVRAKFYCILLNFIFYICIAVLNIVRIVFSGGVERRSSNSPEAFRCSGPVSTVSALWNQPTRWRDGMVARCTSFAAGSMRKFNFNFNFNLTV